MRAALSRLPGWWPVAVAVAVTSPLTLYWWNLIAAGSVAFDWRIFVEAGNRAWAGSPDLYEVNDVYSFRHSPLFALAMPAISWIGVLGIRLVTMAAALAMPSWPMRLLALGSWPFAVDLQHGAMITILVCVAAWALRGSRAAGIAFVILSLLSPRPLMLPIVGFLLWRHPGLRLPTVIIVPVYLLAVLATGYADDWLGMLRRSSLDMYVSPLNLSPSRFIGSAWIPVGLALAAGLVILGKPGLAALAASPYLLPHYLLFALLDLPSSRVAGGQRGVSAAGGSRGGPDRRAG